MPIFGEKPYTSVTVKVNQLCTVDRNQDLEDDSIELYIDDLLHLIKLQPSGTSEAARAIRKKIKYGNSVDEQLLALNMLEILVLNAGPKIGKALANDYKLVQQLQSILSGLGRTGAGGGYSKPVSKKIANMAIGWKLELKDIDGYSGLASLWKLIPGMKSHSRLRSRAHTEPFEEIVEDSSSRLLSPPARPTSPPPRKSRPPRPTSPRPDYSSPPPRPTTRSPYSGTDKPRRKDKSTKKKGNKPRRSRYADPLYKIPQINYKVEAPKIRATISDSQKYMTALQNLLALLPPGEDPSQDKKIVHQFEKCKKTRRAVLRYLQYVGAGNPLEKSQEVLEMDEEFLGILIAANEQLVDAFRKYDKACGYTDEAPNPNLAQPDDGFSESEESYYSSTSSEGEDDHVEDLIALKLALFDVGSSSARLQEVVGQESPLPPLPREPPAKILAAYTGASLESGDPFGDDKQV